MSSRLVFFFLLAGTLACGDTTPTEAAPHPAAVPSSKAPPAPLLTEATAATAAAPAKHAAEPKRLAVYAMALEPDTPAMRAAMEGVFAAWRRCAADPATGCGYQLVDLAHDVDTRSYSLSWAVDELEGPVATCMARHAEELTLTAEVPAGHHYLVAVAVAPTEADLPRCSAGFDAIVSEWFFDEQRVERF